MFCVVCQPCHDCKYTDCVVVCPMDCFYQDEMQVYVHPDECIDCGACVPECPVEAIFSLRDVPAKWHEYIEVNAERARALKETGGNLTEKLEPRLGPGCARHG
ncbi:MAG: ferredoxin family protein [Gemmataceae bacterium]